MKRAFIIISLLFFVACQTEHKGEALVVVSKQLTNLDEYKFYYELVCENSIDCAKILLTSNQNWDVDDIIHIGARWGKKQ